MGNFLENFFCKTERGNDHLTPLEDKTLLFELSTKFSNGPNDFRYDPEGKEVWLSRKRLSEISEEQHNKIMNILHQLGKNFGFKVHTDGEIIRLGFKYVIDTDSKN